MKIIDKIRNASPEKLAGLLCDLTDCGFCNCCGESFSGNVERACDGDCPKCALEWLDSEWDEEEKDSFDGGD